MERIATFYTHYGALSFYKYCQKNEIAAKMAPVPRDISASCGTCVRFSSQYSPAIDEHEDMELCYSINENGVYALPEE